MKIAQLARQLRKSIKEYSALEKTITQFAESAEIAEDQNLVPEFETRLQELYRDWEALRLRIETLTEELQQCIDNGDLEKEPRKHPPDHSRNLTLLEHPRYNRKKTKNAEK